MFLFLLLRHHLLPFPRFGAFNLPRRLLVLVVIIVAVGRVLNDFQESLEEIEEDADASRDERMLGTHTFSKPSCPSNVMCVHHRAAAIPILHPIPSFIGTEEVRKMVAALINLK